MNLAEFEARVNIRGYTTAMKTPEFINTYGAKGPVIILESNGKPLATWTDRKTRGYPNEGIVGKLVFRGGNWKRRREKTPRDVYMAQLQEETRRISKTIPEEADRKIRHRLQETAEAFGDYFSAVPGSVLKNPSLPQPWYCDLVSVFVPRIELAELYDILEMPRAEQDLQYLAKKLDALSPESAQAVVALGPLWIERFGFGDDYKLHDIMREWYGLNVHCEFTRGVEVVRLPGSPETPFEQRRQILDKYLRKDNYPLLAGDDTEGGRVFTRRK